LDEGNYDLHSTAAIEKGLKEAHSGYKATLRGHVSGIGSRLPTEYKAFATAVPDEVGSQTARDRVHVPLQKRGIPDGSPWDSRRPYTSRDNKSNPKKEQKEQNEHGGFATKRLLNPTPPPALSSSSTKSAVAFGLPSQRKGGRSLRVKTASHVAGRNRDGKIEFKKLPAHAPVNRRPPRHYEPEIKRRGVMGTPDLLRVDFHTIQQGKEERALARAREMGLPCGSLNSAEVALPKHRVNYVKQAESKSASGKEHGLSKDTLDSLARQRAYVISEDKRVRL